MGENEETEHKTIKGIFQLPCFDNLRGIGECFFLGVSYRLGNRHGRPQCHWWPLTESFPDVSSTSFVGEGRDTGCGTRHRRLHTVTLCVTYVLVLKWTMHWNSGRKRNGPASLRIHRTRDGRQDLEGGAGEHKSLWAWVCIQPSHDALSSGHLLLLSVLTHFLQCLHSPTPLTQLSRSPSLLQLSCSVPRKVNLCKKKNQNYVNWAY